MAIINHPTGLYDSTLPSKPTDSTSVVYTIGGDVPVIRTSPFIKMPYGIKTLLKSGKIYNNTERRAAVGQLVFNESTHVEAKIRTGQSIYKMGQTIEFNATTDSRGIVPNYVGKSVVTQHNLARLDVKAIGFDDLLSSSVGTGETLDEIAAETYNTLRNQITVLQAQYNSLEADIDALRKSIKETDRAINAINVVLSINPSQDLVETRDQLVANKEIMEIELTTKIELINPIPGQIAVIRDNLAAIAILIE